MSKLCTFIFLSGTLLCCTCKTEGNTPLYFNRLNKLCFCFRQKIDLLSIYDDGSGASLVCISDRFSPVIFSSFYYFAGLKVLQSAYLNYGIQTLVRSLRENIQVALNVSKIVYCNQKEFNYGSADLIKYIVFD